VLEFRILGPLEVVAERDPIPLGGPKQRATLSILLLSRNRVVSVDRFADDLYAGAAPVTAVTQVQRQISELRKALGPASGIETSSPGYVIRLSSDQLDLSRFERYAEEGSQALGRGEATRAADLLRSALGLWRGTALADLAYEPFAQRAIERLDELRLAVLERRIEAELVLGRHRELIGELEQLAREHPLRERLSGHLMLALYRSGRQTEALQVYRRARETLATEFGIEPTPALRELERAILVQDASLVPERPDTSVPERHGSVLVLPRDESSFDPLLAIGEPLARSSERELIIARLIADASDLERAASAVNERCASLSVSARGAAFTTLEPAHDVVRLATTYDAELVVVDARSDLEGDQLPDDVAAILERSPADVGMLAGAEVDWRQGAGVFVPFGGGEHDWAALELGSWLAVATSSLLRLVGTRADPDQGQRDASRLLADASLAVQRVVGIASEPLLAEASEEGLVSAIDAATLVVLGISARWRREGIGGACRALLRADLPVLVVRRGPRPGGLAPRESRTSFTWSIEN
jgi:DNA-binding SARP family transcriptional activator